MCYIKSDIPHRLRTDISCNGNGIEMITIQLKFKEESVFISIMYRPQHWNMYQKNVCAMVHPCI